MKIAGFDIGGANTDLAIIDFDDGEIRHDGVATDEVHFAIQPSAAFIPLYVAKEKGWLDEAMAEYGVSVYWHSFDSGPPINESLLSGESDVGVLGDVPTVFAIALGQELAGLPGEDLQGAGQFSVEERAVFRAVSVHLLHTEFPASLGADIVKI